MAQAEGEKCVVVDRGREAKSSNAEARSSRMDGAERWLAGPGWTETVAANQCHHVTSMLPGSKSRAPVGVPAKHPDVNTIYQQLLSHSNRSSYYHSS